MEATAPAADRVVSVSNPTAVVPISAVVSSSPGANSRQTPERLACEQPPASNRLETYESLVRDIGEA